MKASGCPETPEERRDRWERERQAFWRDLEARNPGDHNIAALRTASDQTQAAIRRYLPKEGELRPFCAEVDDDEIIDLEPQPDGSYR